MSSNYAFQPTASLRSAAAERGRWHSMKYAAAALALSLAGFAVADQTLVVPPDIYELVKAAGCEQVTDFFAGRPSVEKPPYAVHYVEGKLEAAVWCTRDMAKKHHERSYTLVLRFDDKKHPLSKCPARIEGITFIGGLSFIKVNEPAEWYTFNDTGKPIESKGKVAAPAISSIYDGTGNYFVCTGGRWASRELH